MSRAATALAALAALGLLRRLPDDDAFLYLRLVAAIVVLPSRAG